MSGLTLAWILLFASSLLVFITALLNSELRLLVLPAFVLMDICLFYIVTRIRDLKGL